MNKETIYIIVAIAFGLFVILFFALRELYCWYFKTNEIKETLKRIEEKLNKN